MRLFILLGILALPIAEIWLLTRLGQSYGAWVLLYLALMVYLGLHLIRKEKANFANTVQHTMQRANSHPMYAVFGLARNFIIGALLIFPGVLSDVAAAILWLSTQGAPSKGGVANDGIIDTEATEVTEMTEVTEVTNITEITEVAKTAEIAEVTEIKDAKTAATHTQPQTPPPPAPHA